jgi:hypothetical protein
LDRLVLWTFAPRFFCFEGAFALNDGFLKTLRSLCSLGGAGAFSPLRFVHPYLTALSSITCHLKIFYFGSLKKRSLLFGK